MTKRERIINEIKTALETILISNGYATDAGQSVYLDRSSFDNDEVKPFINIDEGEDSIVEQSNKNIGGKFKLSMPIGVEGFNSCDPLYPSPEGHALIGDIKKCLFNTEFSTEIKEIQYQSSTIAQHETGSGLVSVSVNAEIVYIETIGNPED